MGGGAHGGQALGGDPGLRDVGGSEAAVREQLLDVADIGTALSLKVPIKPYALLASVSRSTRGKRLFPR